MAATRKNTKRKATTRKNVTGKKSSSKKTTREYGPKAQQKVERAMHEMHEGTLKSGGSGKRVTSRKQAIAIGLEEARASGAKVPRAKKPSES